MCAIGLLWVELDTDRIVMEPFKSTMVTMSYKGISIATTQTPILTPKWSSRALKISIIEAFLLGFRLLLCM